MDLSFYRQNIEEFMRDIRFVRRKFVLDEELHDAVKSRLAMLNDCPEGVEQYSKVSTIVSQCFWGQQDLECRVAFALVNVFGIMLDDVAPSHKEEYLHSVQQYGSRERISWPLFRHLVEHTDYLMSVIPWFQAYLVKRAVDSFASFTYLETFSPESFKHGDNTVTESFYRQGTSAYEFYIIGVFPFNLDLEEYFFMLPHMGRLVNEVNEFLSCYKESIIGKEKSLYRFRSLGSGKSLEEVLVDSRSRCVEVIRFLQDAKATPRLREALDAFMDRLLNFHFDVDVRYRLSEVGLQFPKFS
ncbi:terpenoid synthase [Penicillium brevicompactum]|uniref:Terpenoid synthase n=1 Tax=Penicillium brevicompactum TaxID=5074 RepID=A0A9W9UL71_PENBR|nr:terpenoid synthase [Penicillium brevicompactum]